MKKTILFWALAFIITGVSAYYQRVTGPTYPKSGSSVIEGEKIEYKLERSSESTQNCPVKIKTSDSSIHAVLKWRPYKSYDPFNEVEMKGTNELSAANAAHRHCTRLPVQYRNRPENHIPSRRLFRKFQSLEKPAAHFSSPWKLRDGGRRSWRKFHDQ